MNVEVLFEKRVQKWKNYVPNAPIFYMDIPSATIFS